VSKSPSLKVVVVGATGRTGRAVVAQTLERGHFVTAFVRSRSKVRETSAKLEIVEGDLSWESALERAVRGRDAVVCAVASETASAPNPVIVHGVADLVRVMQANAVARLLYVSVMLVAEARHQMPIPARWIVPRLLRHPIADHTQNEARALSRGPRSRRRQHRGVEKPWCLDKLGMTGLGTGGHFVRPSQRTGHLLCGGD
jgi:nucleoside-diphosphate-sugar epimerase